jgi:hypothetical protein
VLSRSCRPVRATGLVEGHTEVWRQQYIALSSGATPPQGRLRITVGRRYQWRKWFLNRRLCGEGMDVGGRAGACILLLNCQRREQSNNAPTSSGARA